MDVYQLMDIAVSLSNRLDTHWTLFITVHLALIGGIIYVDRPLQKSEKFAAGFVYSGFAIINSLMMINQVTFLNSVHLDIITFLELPCCKDSHSIAHLAQVTSHGSFKTAYWSIISIHAGMYVLVIASILRDKAQSQEVPQSEASPDTAENKTTTTEK